jgi:molecular chaperone DnaK (HSP70)
MRLGIDFGTTRTLVAAALDGRYPIATFEIGDGYREYLPGYAAHTGDGWVFGWEAAEALRRGAPGMRSLKRRVSGLAPDEPVPGAPDGATALDLVTGFARHVRAALVVRSNLEIGKRTRLETTIAVPANASTRQRYLTIEAFNRAGFEVDALLNEPTAAAVEFAHRNLSAIGDRSPKRYVVVYDLGGGTFDTSAVSLIDRRFELLSTEGIARLGGDDFDAVLLELAARRAGIAPGNLGIDAIEACREAKESLNNNSRKLMIDLGGDREPVVLEVAELYEACEPLVDQTIELLGRLSARLVDYGIDPDNPRELGGIYVVGGGSQLPLVGKRLRSIYKRKIQLAPQSHAATAIGLAICGDPDAGIFIREAVTRYFGVWREAEGGSEKVFDQIISKDTAVGDAEDLIICRGYRPSHTIGNLRFIECARLTGDGQPAGDITPWAEIRFPYDPSFAKRKDLAKVPVERTESVGDAEITETYTYRRDGTIAVDIENRTYGYQRSFVLGNL